LWPKIKREEAQYVAKCLVCQKAKIEHQKPIGMLQSLYIPEWKWDSIAMDFIVGLPRTIQKFDSIWVIVDRLTKSTHFLPINIKYSLENLIDSWDRCLPWIEFTYNNSFQSSIGMAPFEALYGRKCRKSLCWFKTSENLVLGPHMIQQTIEKIKMIKDKLKATQIRQKSYADKKR